MDPKQVPVPADLFAQAGQRDPVTCDKLHSLIYAELHEIARQYMRGERRGHTLQPTALVNEAYLRLSASGQPEWQSRGHFLAKAAVAMRYVLVDHARGRLVRAHESLNKRSAMDHIVVTYEDRALDLLALDSALTRLAQFAPRMARAVELRFFAGLEMEQVARALGISKRTLEREWAVTRAWLHQEIA